jgi:hypothetical protein
LENTPNSATENLLHFNSILVLPDYLTVHMTCFPVESLIAITKMFQERIGFTINMNMAFRFAQYDECFFKGDGRELL